jgi:hypothetical protein
LDQREPQLERRRLQRCGLREPVTVKFWDFGVRELAGVAHNASPDGIFLETEAEIPADRQIAVAFLFPGTLRSPGVRFTCRCRVVRVTGSPGKFGVAAAILRTASERLDLSSEAAEALPCSGLAMAD